MTSGRVSTAALSNCVVVDASVAVKWFVPEPGARAARALLQSTVMLVAPSQICVEVAGALLRRMREETLIPERARRALDEWLTMLNDGTISIVDNAKLFEPAIDLSFTLRHPLADCLYLALSKTNAAELFTFDDKMKTRGAKLCRVKLLNIHD